VSCSNSNVKVGIVNKVLQCLSAPEVGRLINKSINFITMKLPLGKVITVQGEHSLVINNCRCINHVITYY
jgi:hypothetical protein